MLAIAAPRRVIAVAVLVSVGAAIFGIPVTASLSAGGFQDPASESSQAARLMAEKFRQSDQQLLIEVTSPDIGVDSAQTRQVGTDIVDHLERSSHVLSVSSAWTSPPAVAAQLVSKNVASGVIVANLGGGEYTAMKYADCLSSFRRT
jgi:RND superfamily putative drug exporter